MVAHGWEIEREWGSCSWIPWYKNVLYFTLSTDAAGHKNFSAFERGKALGTKQIPLQALNRSLFLAREILNSTPDAAMPSEPMTGYNPDYPGDTMTTMFHTDKVWICDRQGVDSEV